MRSGEYVSFIDSDDYIANDYIEKIYNATESNSIDYVRCFMMNRKTTEITPKTYIKENGDFQEVYKMLLNTYLLNPVWCGMIKTQILKNNNIRFIEDYNYLEDYIFNIEILKNINTLKYIKYNGYYYRVNEESLTNKFEQHKLINKINIGIDAYKRLYNLFSSDEDKEKIDKRIEGEVNQQLDSIFYAKTKTKIKERMELYEKAHEVFIKDRNIFKSLDILLLINKHYLLYDIKNNIFKKLPRKIKHMIIK